MGNQTIKVPDIGGNTGVEIIEVAVSEGNEVGAEDTLITLESDKASMDIPSPWEGRVISLQVKEGDTVSEGDVIGTINIANDETSEPSTDIGRNTNEQDCQKELQPQKLNHATEASRVVKPESTSSSVPRIEDDYRSSGTPVEQSRAQANQKQPSAKDTSVHAGPAVRQMARELGIELSEVPSSGPKGRILKEDVEKFLRSVMEGRRSGNGLTPVKTSAGDQAIPPMPEIDFSQFGEVEERPMGRLMKAGAGNLHRSWLNVPHVTQFDEADITDLEAYRQSLKEEYREQGARLTLLPFVLKGVANALRDFPQFNVSLRGDGETVVWKKYFHIGVAVDSPSGLLVPVIRDVDRKGVSALAKELTELSERAHEGKLGQQDMQGGCFTISSLGAIGGKAFTPIVKSPEVAILGISKSVMKPAWNGKEFMPRLKLPLSLSYDHRAVNGADAARFVEQIGSVLRDIRKLLL